MPLPVRRTGNPMLNERTFGGLPRMGIGVEGMTLKGTIDKSFLLLIVLMAAALWPWSQLAGGDVQAVSSTALLGAFGGFILAMIVGIQANHGTVPRCSLRGAGGLCSSAGSRPSSSSGTTALPSRRWASPLACSLPS